MIISKFDPRKINYKYTRIKLDNEREAYKKGYEKFYALQKRNYLDQLSVSRF